MKKQKLPLLFLALPGIILIFLFGYLPLFGLVIAFKNVDYSKGIWASDWVGLKNFEFFFKSNDALRVTRNTLVMNALFIVFTLIVSVSVAIMLYYVGRRMLRVTQTVLFLPYLISWVVASYALEAFIDARYGVVNQFLNFLGLKNINFYYLPKWWYLIIVICYIWKSAGYYSILYYTRLLSVDPSLYEAAEMDHASAWQKFKDITLPELKPLCVFIFITVTIGAFRMLVQPMVMTGGGPDHSTYTLVYDIYETGTMNWEMGLASTMAVVFTVFVVILTIIQNILTKGKEEKHVNQKAKNM